MSVEHFTCKGLSILIVFALVFSFGIPVSAEAEPIFTVGTASANAGDTDVTIPVSVTNCPPFVGLGLEFTYDTEALTLTEITRGAVVSGGDLTPNPEGGRLWFDWSQAAFPDGEIFVLKFAVNPSAGTGDYSIGAALSEAGWANNVPEQLTGTFVPGVITVTGDPTVGHAAYYDGRDYLTVKDAIDAVVSAGGIGIITMINDTTIETYDDRIIIPANADITLDMNSHIITSVIPYNPNDLSCVVEIKKDGKLNLVDNSAAKTGQFIHATGEYNSRFLVNSGTLNMSNIDVIDFSDGIADGSYIGGSTGTYGTISNCTLETGQLNAMAFENAYVEAITGCTIRTQKWGIDIKREGKISLLEDCIIIGESTEDVVLVFGGTIETIRDCTITGLGRVLCNFGGTIGKITSTSSSKHTTISGELPVYNGGTITLIESDHTLLYRSRENTTSYDCIWNTSAGTYGRIETISGGTFDSDARAVYMDEGTSIGTISGGIFKGEAYSAIQIAGTINSITGGVFISGPQGGYPLYSSKAGASIGSVTGGYYKNTNSEFDLFYAVDGATINIPDGYGFSTVSATINEETGFYHLGETVKITWKIEDEEETDILIVGDPVAYRGDEPTKTGYIFAGWSDGDTLYRPAQMLPAATADVIYTAQFDEIGSEEDYTVSLATAAENVNAGEEFTVDVNITSSGNNSFYGATIEVTYDNSQVDYNGAPNIPESFGITSSTSGTTTTLEIVGAAQSGYAMTDHAYKLATLGFKAKSDVTTGPAAFGIKDNPIVDQQYAVHSQFVTKGDVISVNLWNLTVTFQAGANVNMATETAYVKYNEAGLYTDTTYETSFTEPVPVAAAHYTLDVPVWKPESGGNVDFETINNTAFTGNAVYTATAFPSSFTVTLPEDVNVISGITEGKATYLTDIVFTVDEVPGYVNGVTYTVGDGEPVTLTADVEGKYTIPGSVILDSIVVNVEHVVHGTVTFISNDDFNSPPTDYQVLLFTVDNKLNTGAYEYDGEAMFYSGKYSIAGKQVYLYVVPNEVTEDGALTKLQINATANPCLELAYNGDINLDDRFNSTDAVLTYALYGGLWTGDEFTKVNMRMRLEADVNGDKVVDTADTQKILNNIWGVNED